LQRQRKKLSRSTKKFPRNSFRLVTNIFLKISLPAHFELCPTFGALSYREVQLDVLLLLPSTIFKPLRRMHMTRLGFLASASTLALGLAFSAAAYAQEALPNNADTNQGIGNASNGSTANSTSTTASGNTLGSNNPDSSTNTSDSNNPDSSTHTTASNNTLTDDHNRGIGNASSGGTATTASGNTVASNNTDSSTHQTDSNNTRSRTRTDADADGFGNATTGGTANTGSGNAKGYGNATTGGTATNTDNSTSKSGNTVASNNTIDSNNTDSHNDNRVRTDSHNDNRVDSHNYSDSSSKVFTITATVSNQDLSGTVTDNTATLGGSEENPTAASTGAITGNTYTSFAGIQTANSNTGLNSLGQAATSIAANANVSFGTP
jgi:hypothetical protein